MQIQGISPGLRARVALEKHGFSFTHSLGQNFILDDDFLEEIALEAGVGEGEAVLEIGPGPGLLTHHLASHCRKVLALEIDRKLEPVLSEVLEGVSNAEVVFTDVMKCDLPALLEERFPGEDVQVVANLPYYITADVIERLLTCGARIGNITVMVQKEAAQRLCAAPGTREAGAISYAVAYYAQPKLLFTVQPGSFYPAPKVTSAVIQLTLHPQPPVRVPGGDEAGYFRLIRAAFSQRRKTAANAIANGLSLPKAQVLAALQDAGLDARLRPEQLTLQDFCALQTALTNRGCL